MEKIEKKIKDFIKINNLIPKNSKILLGLSGGPDSVFLLHFLANLRDEGIIKEIIAAHLDHKWRPESFQDTVFCRNIATKYGALFVTANMSDLDTKFKFEGSKEELGRQARRLFLEKIQKEYNCDAIALAHHAQDQEETFFIRLIRGTSLSGLTGIKPKYGPYVRPLLEVNKKDIINFLEKNNIPYLTDPSNKSQEFLRNRIRHTVIPALQACDARFDRNFKITLDRLKETDNFLQQLTHQIFTEISHTETKQKELKIPEKTTLFYININQLLNLHPIMLYRVLIHWLIAQNVKFPVAKSFLDEIITFLKKPTDGEHQLYKNWSLIKKKNMAYIKS